MPDQFIDSPGPNFIDAPGPSSGDNWQSRVKPVQIPGYKPTVMRDDGAVWMDASKGYKGSDGPGWKYKDEKTGLFAPAPDKPTTEMGWAERNVGPEAWKSLGRNLKAGFTRPGEALAGLGYDVAHAVGAMPDQEYLDKINALESQERYRQALKGTSGTGAGLAQFTGEAVPQLAAMALTKRMLPAAGPGFASRAAAEAIPAALTTYATTPGTAQERTKAAEVAAAGAPIAMGLVEKGFAPALEWLAGKSAKLKGVMSKVEEIRQATRSRQFPQGAEPTLAEAGGSPLGQAAENKLEYIPLSGRKAQLEQQGQAMKAALGEARDRMAAPIGAQGAGADIAASAERQLGQLRKIYGAPIEEVKNLVDAVPGVVKPTNIVKAIDDAIARESRYTGNQAAVESLEKLKTDFESGKYADTMATLLEEKRRFQSDAAALGKDPTPLNQRLKRIYDSLSNAAKQDARAAAMAADPSGTYVAQLEDAWANYAKNVHPFNPSRGASWSEKGTLNAARTLRGKETFENRIPDDLFRGDDPSMAKYAWSALDTQGRMSVKGEIMNRIMNAAEESRVGFSPAKAITAMEKHKNFIDHFFTAEEKNQIKGLRNAFDTMRRAGQYMEQVQTGKYAEQVAIPKMAIAGAVGTVAGATGGPALLAEAAAAIPAARFAAWATGTRAGKDWLMKAASLKPMSEAMKKHIVNLGKVEALRQSQEQE